MSAGIHLHPRSSAFTRRRSWFSSVQHRVTIFPANFPSGRKIRYAFRENHAGKRPARPHASYLFLEDSVRSATLRSGERTKAEDQNHHNRGGYRSARGSDLGEPLLATGAPGKSVLLRPAEAELQSRLRRLDARPQLAAASGKVFSLSLQ